MTNDVPYFSLLFVEQSTLTKRNSFPPSSPHLVEGIDVLLLVDDRRLIPLHDLRELLLIHPRLPHKVLRSHVRGDERSLQHVQIHSHVLGTRTDDGQTEVDQDQVARCRFDEEVGSGQISVDKVVVVELRDHLAQLEAVCVQFLFYSSEERGHNIPEW